MKNLKLSIIIVFHNMQREAARTLFSLSTKYQKFIKDADYEVIAIDSNSAYKLNEFNVLSYGPQFKYIDLYSEHPSPCKALNLGVKHAESDNIVLIIDGARILSPGILSKFIRGLSMFDNPFIYTIGMHLGPDIQNISLLNGYNQSIEDKLLLTIDWHNDGYKLFSISSFALSCPDGFASKVNESNCFAIKKKTFFDLGGFDENFISPGGGLCNLDFFNRVMEHEDIIPVVLEGEATFHQFHGGIATNIPMADHPFEDFLIEYKKIRFDDYLPLYRRPFYI